MTGSGDAKPRIASMPRVFMSYVRDDTERVERMCGALEANGVDVWLDKYDIQPGADWQDAIRRAIGTGDFFIACFSDAWQQRPSTHMNEELTLAIEELRRRPRDRTWFIPVVFSGDVPDWDIGAGKTLRSLQWVDLAPSRWNAGMERLLGVLQEKPPPPAIEVRLEALGSQIEDARVSERLDAVRKLADLAPAEGALTLLSRALHDSQPSIVSTACGALRAFGERAVPALVSALEDERTAPDSRTFIIGTLGGMHDTGAPAVPALLRLLETSAEFHGLVIIMALGEIAEPAELIVPAMAAAVESDDAAIRQAAAHALARMGSPDALRVATEHERIEALADRLDGRDEANRLEAIDALAEAGDAAVAAVVRSLQFGSEDAKTVLERIGAAAVPTLIAVLEDPDGFRTDPIAEVLGRIGDASAVPPLLRSLAEDENGAAATALGRIGETAAIPALVDAIAGGAATEAMHALVALGPAAVPVLLDSLETADETVRSRAAEVLGGIGDVRARPRLGAMLRDPADDVRDAAAAALLKVGADESMVAVLVETGLAERGRPGECAEQLLIRLGAAAVAAVCEQFQASDSTARDRVKRILGAIGGPFVIDAMAVFVRDELAETDAVRDAIEVLSQCGTDAIPILGEALGVADTLAASCAAEAMGEIGSEAAVPALMRALTSGRLYYNEAPAEALGRIGGSAIPLLIEAMTRDEQTNLQSQVAQALGVAGDDAHEAVVALLQHPIERVRYFAARILGRPDNVAAIAPLAAAFISDPPNRKEICVALGRIGGPQVVPVLLDALEDADQYVGDAAASALDATGLPEAKRAAAAFRKRRR